MSKFALDSSEDKSLGIISPAKNRWKYKIKAINTQYYGTQEYKTLVTKRDLCS